MTGVAHISIGRDTHKLKMRVRFRFRFMEIGSWSCESTKSWPKVQDADDVVTSNEYTLVLWQILVCVASDSSLNSV